MKIKYIYFDIDNTLNHKKEGNEIIPKDIIMNLRYFVTKNIAIGIATTRGLIRAKDAVDNVPNLPFIILNGGEIYSTNNNLLLTNPLSSNEKKQVLKLISKNISSIEFIAFYPAGSIYGKIYAASEAIGNIFRTKYKHTFQEPSSVTENLDTFEYWLLHTNTSMVEIKSKRILDISDQNLNISYDGIYYINAHKINKGIAIDYICKKMDINPKNLLVVGDADTDLSMFKIKGVTSIRVGKNKLRSNYQVDSPRDLMIFLNTFLKI